MFGGIQFGSSDDKPKAVSNVEVFDTKTRSWKSTRSLLEGSGHHSSVLVPSSWFDKKWGKFEAQNTKTLGIVNITEAITYIFMQLPITSLKNRLWLSISQLFLFCLLPHVKYFA